MEYGYSIEKLLGDVSEIDMTLSAIATKENEEQDQMLAEVQSRREATEAWLQTRAIESPHTVSRTHLAAVLRFANTRGYPELTIDTDSIKLRDVATQHLASASLQAMVTCNGIEGEPHPAKGGPVSFWRLVVALCATNGPSLEAWRLPDGISQWQIPSYSVARAVVLSHDIPAYNSPENALADARTSTLCKELWQAACDPVRNPALFQPGYIQGTTRHRFNFIDPYIESSQPQ